MALGLTTQSKALKAGVAAQKVQMKEINLDDLEDLQEDMMEMMEDQEEIQEIMGQNFATDEVDEGELLDGKQMRLRQSSQCSTKTIYSTTSKT